MEPVRETFRTHGSASFDKKTRSRRRKAVEVTTIRVNADVWRVALDLAQGDALRIKVVSEEEVVVLNRRR